MLINISRELCIGAAPCVAVAGDVFQLDEEGKAIQVGPITDEVNTRLAAEACPVRAIFVYDDAKVQLFPPVDEMPHPYVPETIHGEAAANDNSSTQTTPAVPSTLPAIAKNTDVSKNPDTPPAQEPPKAA